MGLANIFFGLRGRIGRKSFWFSSISVAAVTTCFVFLTLRLGLIAFKNLHPEFTNNHDFGDWILKTNPPDAELFIFASKVLFISVSLILFWSLVAHCVKRLHDRGLSGVWSLILILPFLALLSGPVAQAPSGVISIGAMCFAASLIWGIWQFAVLKGQDGANRYGPDPLATHLGTPR